MAPTAEDRNVDNSCRRFLVSMPFDRMVLVACHAGGGKRITLEGGSAVQALPMLFNLCFVTLPTRIQLSNRLRRCVYVMSKVAVHTMGVRLAVETLFPMWTSFDFPGRSLMTLGTQAFSIFIVMRGLEFGDRLDVVGSVASGAGRSG